MNIFLILITLLFMGMGAGDNTSTSDTNTKTDVGQVVSAVNTYQANNWGALPPEQYITSGEFARIYMKDSPTISPYEYRTTGGDSKGSMVIRLGSTCNGTSSSRRVFSVSSMLGNGERYCLDNS